MARSKQGLDYFPCATSFDLDVRSVFATLGAEARSVWLTVMQECYRSGTPELMLTPQSIIALARDAEITPDRLSIIIRGFAEVGVFSLPHLLDFNKIVSHGVAKQIARIQEDRDKDRSRKQQKPIFQPDSPIPPESGGIRRNHPVKEKETEMEKEIETTNTSRIHPDFNEQAFVMEIRPLWCSLKMGNVSAPYYVTELLAMCKQFGNAAVREAITLYAEGSYKRFDRIRKHLDPTDKFRMAKPKDAIPEYNRSARREVVEPNYPKIA